jgi:replicative DNA helicase Mcm
VEESDAEVAIDLFRDVMRKIMTDKQTGMFDIDTVTTGKPKSERERMEKVDTIMEIVKELLRKNDMADLEEVVENAKSYAIDEPTARRILTELLRKGTLYEKAHGHVKIAGE